MIPMVDAAAPPQVPERRLAAILSADIAGYSRLMGQDETATIRDLKGHQAVVLPLPAQHGGTVIDIAGDGILAQFPSAVRAVECAVAIQRSMAERNHDVPDDRKMLFRIGVNLGDVVHDGTRIYGDGINIAARLQAIAEPGGICISAKVHDEVVGKLGLPLRDLGEKTFKNISRPVRTYEVRPEGAPAPRTWQRQSLRRAGIVLGGVVFLASGILGVYTTGLWRHLGGSNVQGIQVFSLPTDQDLQRVKDIATRHSLILPAFAIQTPKGNVAVDALKFVGIWASDVGYNGVGRQVMLIVTLVDAESRAQGFYTQGPAGPGSFDAKQGPGVLPFGGNISGDTLSFTNDNTGSVFTASFDINAEYLNLMVRFRNGKSADIILRPVWKLAKGP
jgi:class 3 adenylate cyclase